MSVETGTLLYSDQAAYVSGAYVSGTHAGRACISARLAGSILTGVVGESARARSQQLPQRVFGEASGRMRHSLSFLGKLTEHPEASINVRSPTLHAFKLI